MWRCLSVAVDEFDGVVSGDADIERAYFLRQFFEFRNTDGFFCPLSLRPSDFEDIIHIIYLMIHTRSTVFCQNYITHTP